MWSSNNQTNSKRLTSNLKLLKLVSKASEIQPGQSAPTLDPSSTTTIIDSSINSTTWRKELRLTRVVERERKKLSTVTTSSCSTSTSYSSISSRVPPTPSDLPRLDDRLSLLDEKLEVVENMFSARKQMFDLLGKDSDLLNLELQKEIQRRNSTQSIQHSHSNTQPPDQQHTQSSTTITSEIIPTTQHSPHPSAHSPDNTNTTAGWGDYFKKLW